VPVSFFSSSPSRAGVEGCPDTRATGARFWIETPQVSWLGDSLRLFLHFRKSNQSSSAAFPFRPESRDSELRTVARAENFRLTVARRRRIFTVFPYAESQVIVDGAPTFLESPLAKVSFLLRVVEKLKNEKLKFDRRY
jgi:hypothetical protein